MIYRIYTENKFKEGLLKNLDGYLPAYTVYEGQGRWQGSSEPSLVIEYIGSETDHALVRNIAACIKGYNSQQAVLVIKIQEAESFTV